MIRNVTVVRGPMATDLVDAAHTYKTVLSVKSPTGVSYPVSPTNGYTPSNSGNQFSLVWAGASQPAAGAQYIVIFDDGGTGFQMRGGDFIKSAFVACLRAAFQTQDFYPLYKYNADDTLTKLSIYDSFPKRVFKNPAIIVSVGPSKISRTELDSDDTLHEVRETPGGPPTGVFAWGKVLSPVTITVVALSDRDRRKLTDLVGLFCQHLFRGKFAAYGIGYKDVTTAGETDTEWQGQLLYTNSVTVDCYTEYQINYGVDLLDTIRDLVITTEADI